MPRVSLAYVRFDHHSRWSGYPRIAEHLDGLVDARRLKPWRVPEPLGRRIAARMKHGWYGTDDLGLDIAAARRLAVGRNEVVHLLYGEHGHRVADLAEGRRRRRGNRLVATFHQPPFLQEGELAPAAALLYDGLDHAIALGPVAAASLAARLGEDRVSRAFLGVDTEAWCPGGERSPEPLCAFVGAWMRDLDLLEAVVAAVREARPGIRFEAVTSPEHAPRLDAWDGMTARSGVSDEDLRDLYRRAWVHVLPLRDAVGCNGLLEGMACGLATVATAVGDVEA